MKISVIDKKGSGITQQFAKAIGATSDGRFVRIPPNKGGGYITGFSWSNAELRMMVRNYFLHQEIILDRTNQLDEGQNYVVFLISGIFQMATQNEKPLTPELASVFICRQTVSSVLTMPSNTEFSSVTIAVSQQYLSGLFGNILHPVVTSILETKENFAFETGISPEMIKTSSEILQPPVPESMESNYCKLKCEELLFHVFSMLVQREALPTTGMHIKDIQAIYAVKQHLQAKTEEPPHIGSLAKMAGMSAPKMRKLFKQTFGKGVFEYYQMMRMQKAAELLREKRLSVSEVGYALGFTNLGHFAKVFEQQTGIKPKKFSLA